MWKIICILFIFFVNEGIVAQEPTNIEIVKQRIKAYVHEGTYFHEVESEIENGIRFLDHRLSEPHQHRLAVVLDIDETAVSNYDVIEKSNFGHLSFAVDKKIVHGHYTAISATHRLYDFARTHDVAVFFVTGRPEKYHHSTEKNLNEAGYPQWDGLFLRPNSYHLKSISNYKKAARQKITQQGYEIVLNVGDQTSDLVGGYADHTIKLPNPFYLIP